MKEDVVMPLLILYSISLFFNFISVVLWVLLKDYKKFHKRLVIVILVCSMIQSITLIVSVHSQLWKSTSSGLCWFLSPLAQFLRIFCTCWDLIIMINIYRVIVHQTRLGYQDFAIYLWVSGCFSLLLTFLPLAGAAYCNIVRPNDMGPDAIPSSSITLDAIWELCTLYVLIPVASVTIAILSFLIIRHIWTVSSDSQSSNPRQSSSYSKFIRYLIGYPVIFICTLLPAFICRIQVALTEPSYPWVMGFLIPRSLYYLLPPLYYIIVSFDSIILFFRHRFSAS